MSLVSGAELTRWITAQRPPRTETLDPHRPHGFFVEQERAASGRILDSATILLTNRECPWRCLMCDLWKNTLTAPVPPGAIPEQISFALTQLQHRPEQLKLYNSGSFFDSGAIPVQDYPVIAARISFADYVIVESHPRLVGDKALRLRNLLAGSLEVAMGLETIHPGIFPRLNKKFDLDQFAKAAQFLRAAGIAVRAFVLVNPPFLKEKEGIEWAVKSAAFGFDCGAEVVSLIPTRAGNGVMDRLLESGEFSPPKLSALEAAQELALDLHQGRVFADVWDLGQFSRCGSCLERRRQRLLTINLTQQPQPRVVCQACDGL